MSRRIAVVGAGQSGLQLALGLLGEDYEVTLVSNRTGEQLLAGPVQSSQCMFQSALATERALGLDFFNRQCPPVEGIAFTAVGAAGGKAINWAARLDGPAQSVDQRLKLPRWLSEFEERGGRLLIHEATAADLDGYTREHELVVVATGRRSLGDLFARDADKSAFEAPQRALALTYVRGMEPRHGYSAVCFNVIPGIGEYFVFPALTTTGPCEIMVFEGIPGGPMDCWEGLHTPSEHLTRSLEILERFLPWEHARCAEVELTDEQGVLAGRFTPTVRRPIAQLASGRPVLAIADAAVLNDPITGQGSNNAAKCAEIYLERVLSHGNDPFDERWMQETFDHYWRAYARSVVAWTDAMLTPPRPHVERLLTAAQELPALAATIANGFDDPRTLHSWWFDELRAQQLIEENRAEQQRGLDVRGLRRALGQFATGVTIVTACNSDGSLVGLTVNSFTSLSLEPPLVLWCLDRDASSLPAFRHCTHFGVNVLNVNQHHLSRLFATPGANKFADATLRQAPAGVPLLEGVLAHFVCRQVRQIDLGDHVIMIGEVEHYETFAGEPLVFHSGSYRVTTRHPGS